MEVFCNSCPQMHCFLMHLSQHVNAALRVLDWDEDSFPRISNVASSCECTGMMPRPPENEEEDEAYRSLFSNELPRESL